MELTVNLRHLEKKPVELKGEVSPAELEIEGVDELIHTPFPLKYDLVAESVGNSVLVQGNLSMVLECEC